MVIGFDIDYTIANPNKRQSELVEEYLSQLGKEPIVVDETKFGILQRFGFSKKEDRDFWEKVGSDVLTNSEPMEDAVEVFKKLKQDGHQIVLITARGNTDMLHINPYVLSFYWLKKHGFVYDKIVCRDTEKVEACKKLGVDVFVDDNIKVLRKLENADCETILMTAPHNLHFNDSQLPKNAQRAQNFNDVYNIISNLASEKVC